MRLGILCLLLLVLCSLLPALDFGLVLDQNANYGDLGNDTNFTYEGILLPRLSGLLGDNGGFYVSAGLSYESNPWAFVPELLRTDMYWHFGAMEITMGRMFYSDPLGFIAAGLFDGGHFSYIGPAGTFSAGAWYTGLLNKKRAVIEMTPNELAHNNTNIDYNDFVNTYFAPRRVLAALDWEHQGFMRYSLLKLSLLGQFDLSGENLNSQYLAGKILIPAGRVIFDLGGCVELLQNTGDFDTGFAADLGVAWQSSAQRLALLGRYSSASFLPINTIPQGHIMEYKLSGISFISLDYTAKLHRTFSLGLSSFYFMNSPTVGNLEQAGRFLGAEFYGALYWSPFSDLSLTVGGGAFLPSLGNMTPDAKNLWRVDMNIVFSLY